jgi:hypothetical protein
MVGVPRVSGEDAVHLTGVAVPGGLGRVAGLRQLRQAQDSGGQEVAAAPPDPTCTSRRQLQLRLDQPVETMFAELINRKLRRLGALQVTELQADNSKWVNDAPQAVRLDADRRRDTRNPRCLQLAN